MHFLAIELFSFLRPCLKKPQRPGITERVCDLRGLLSRKVRKTAYEVIKKYLWTHPKGNCDENESWLGVLASRFGAPASPFKNFLYKVNSGVGALGESDSVHCRKPFNERMRVHTVLEICLRVVSGDLRSDCGTRHRRGSCNSFYFLHHKSSFSHAYDIRS